MEKKRAESRKNLRKKIARLLLPASKEKLLPVFGPSYVPILNENMAKSSPLSRNDQTFCCPFPFPGFQIVSSVSSSSSSLPRRARCSFNSFNAFIFFFFWNTQSEYYPPPACCCGTIIILNQKSQNERQRRTKLSLSLSSQKRWCVCAFSSRVKSNDTIYY